MSEKISLDSSVVKNFIDTLLDFNQYLKIHLY